MAVKEKRKSVLFVVFIAVVLIGIVLGTGGDQEPFGFMKVADPEDAAEFLKELGWECDLTSASVQETTLPEQFDDTFIGYNSIQLQQGCDLTKYAGKNVVIFTVPITNYTEASGTVYATLIIHRNKVIGGDIHAAEMDGFMHTLR